MGIRLTTLSENAVGRIGVIAEWGLSILVEIEGIKVLLDTGQGASVTYNAAALNIDLSNVSKIVLSHGHADHTGGLRKVLRRVSPIDIIAHPDIWIPKYVMRPEEKRKTYIGLPFRREELEGLGASFNLSREPVWISDDIVTTGEIPMVTGYENIDSNLYIKENGEFRSDALRDDLALIIKTDFGLIVILGCAHRGIINTLKYAQEITGVEHIHTVIGGTHLIRASEEQIELTISELRKFEIQKLGVSHCTGMAASLRLWQEFGDSFFFNNAGLSVTLP